MKWLHLILLRAIIRAKKKLFDSDFDFSKNCSFLFYSIIYFFAQISSLQNLKSYAQLQSRFRSLASLIILNQLIEIEIENDVRVWKVCIWRIERIRKDLEWNLKEVEWKINFYIQFVFMRSIETRKIVHFVKNRVRVWKMLLLFCNCHRHHVQRY